MLYFGVRDVEFLLLCSIRIGRRAVNINHGAELEGDHKVYVLVKVPFVDLLAQAQPVLGVREHGSEEGDDGYAEVASRGD